MAEEVVDDLHDEGPLARVSTVQAEEDGWRLSGILAADAFDALEDGLDGHSKHG